DGREVEDGNAVVGDDVRARRIRRKEDARRVIPDTHVVVRVPAAGQAEHGDVLRASRRRGPGFGGRIEVDDGGRVVGGDGDGVGAGLHERARGARRPARVGADDSRVVGPDVEDDGRVGASERLQEPRLVTRLHDLDGELRRVDDGNRVAVRVGRV